MLTNQQQHNRTRLLIAGSIGLLIAIITTVWISVPTLGLLPQFLQLTPLARIAIIIRLLSPVLSFLLATCWVWVLLRVVQWVRSHSTTRNQEPPSAEPVRQRLATYHLVLVGSPPETIGQDPYPGSKAIGERPLAAPPLFQLDPQRPWLKQHLPVTPLPEINPAWIAAQELTPTQECSREEETENEEESGAQEPIRITQAEQIIQSQVVDEPDQLKEEETREKAMTVPFSLRQTEELENAPPVTLTLLKQVRVWVRADDGTTIEVKLRRGENAIRLIQLAYIAWRKGTPVDRDKMLTYVLSRGKRRDMTAEQLGEVFDAAKRYLRKDLDRAVKELESNGHPVSQEIDFFSNEPGFYWLHPCCRVVDLERIEREYQSIQQARKEGLLNEKPSGLIPEWVLEACQRLIRAYPGDFLQSLIEKFPDEFGSWVREPLTFYRDRYLDALLILAQNESALGRNFHEESLSEEQNEEKRRYHIGRAAQLFYDYAMYAINSRWDQKVKFAYRAGKDGERVIRAARALRRCVVELGKLGNPDMIDQVYLAFKERMANLSEGTWKPDRDTESDVAEAKRTTSAYRFASQVQREKNTA